MRLEALEQLSTQLRTALALNPDGVAPLLCEITQVVDELRQERPEKARVLRVWRQNRALLGMLRDALGDTTPRMGARA